MAMLSPDDIKTRFLAWVNGISERFAVELIPIDGKDISGLL
jgi:hypothetical protein